MSAIAPPPLLGPRRYFPGLLGPKDLLPDEFPVANWDTGQGVASLETLRHYVAREAKQAADWYIRKRSLKRRAGQASRLTALVAVAAASVLPVLAQILGQNGQFAFPPTWASILLAAAALLGSLDYFLGYTSGWV